MYNIQYEGIPLNVEVEFTPSQRGGLETQPIDAGFLIKEINHNGQDIYPIISGEAFNTIEGKVKEQMYAR